MEITTETVTNVINADTEREFVAGSNDFVSAKYFIIIQNSELNQEKICGRTMLEWVSRACPEKPIILNEGEDLMSLVSSYSSGYDYSVVLYSNTPLVTKNHLNDLVAFFDRKNMSAMRLKKGFIFKNEYLSTVGEIYSTDAYDFSTNDFFEVNTFEDVAFVEKNIQKRIVEFLRKNDSHIENDVAVDAGVKVGFKSVVKSDVSLLSGTNVGDGCLISCSSVVENSKIEDDVKIGKGAIIVHSVVKNGATIGDGCVIKNSVVGENSIVGDCVKIKDSATKQNTIIDDFVCLSNVRVFENVKIQKFSKIIGINMAVPIMKGAVVGANSKIVDKKIEENENVKDNSCIIFNEE